MNEPHERENETSIYFVRPIQEVFYCHIQFAKLLEAWTRTALVLIPDQAYAYRRHELDSMENQTKPVYSNR